jgi:diguanylate cyclase (GGDEF)-like protein/PAS domain S-box-containing protein
MPFGAEPDPGAGPDVTVPEQFLRTLLAELQDAVVVKDLAGRYLMVNDAAATQLGLAAAEYVGQTDATLFPETAEAIGENDRVVVQTGEPITVEEPAVVDGELRTYLSTKAPLRDAGGTICGVVGISTDITARKKLEDELRSRTAQLEEAQVVARAGSWERDIATDRFTWSPGLYEIYGLDPETVEPNYETAVEGVHPDDREAVIESFDRALESGGSLEMTCRIVRPDGTERTVLYRGRVFADADGTPLRVVGVTMDVTERAELTERLESREAQLKAAQELTRVGSFEWNLETNAVIWSDALYRIFGYEPGAIEVTYETFLEHVHPEEREQRRLGVQAALEGDAEVADVARIVCPDRKVRWIESRLRALRDPQGNPTKLIGACQDVTDRKQTADTLQLEADAAHARSLRDPLTMLPNRDLALDRLEQALEPARRGDGEVGVLFIDVNGFKQVNDSLGHVAGDQVLVAIAGRLRGAVGNGDTVARFGGDEFLVLCEQRTDAAAMVELGMRLLDAFEAPLSIAGAAHTLNLAIGISSAGERPVEARQLISEADAAMYSAKRHRGSAVQLHRPG